MPYPSVNLSAFIGPQVLGLGKFFDAGSIAGNIGPANAASLRGFEDVRICACAIILLTGHCASFCQCCEAALVRARERQLTCIARNRRSCLGDDRLLRIKLVIEIGQDGLCLGQSSLGM